MHYFLIFAKTFLLRNPKMPRKVTLQIKFEGLELLKKQSIRETTRIINMKHSMDLSPSTKLRWKKQEDSILKNMAVTKAAKKTINCSNQIQLDFEAELHNRCMDSFSRGVRLFSFIIKSKGRELQKEEQYSDFQCSFGKKWFKSFKKVGSKLEMILETQS